MRYFFVSYRCDNSSKYAYGNIGIISEQFPSMEYLKEIALKRNPSDMAAIITGWQEFISKEDYDLFFGNSIDE